MFAHPRGHGTIHLFFSEIYSVTIHVYLLSLIMDCPMGTEASVYLREYVVLLGPFVEKTSRWP
jgi:hypothetical protein